MEEKFNLLPLLDYIDPATLTYQEWVDVGMALKHEGYSVSEWDNWSQSDHERFHEGECEKKWASFEGANSPITGATITQMAKENGWHSENEDDTAFDWDDSFVATESNIDKGYKLVNTDWIMGEQVIAPKNWNPAQQIIDYLEALFAPGDIIGYVNNAYPKTSTEGEVEKWLPSKGVYTRTAGEIIEGLKRNNGDVGAIIGDPNPQAGAWIRLNPLDGNGVKNTNVVDYRYALIESDTTEIEKQNEIIRKLELPIAALSYSGHKSLHAVVKVDAINYPQYQERVDYLFKIVEKKRLTC